MGCREKEVDCYRCMEQYGPSYVNNCVKHLIEENVWDKAPKSAATATVCFLDVNHYMIKQWEYTRRLPESADNKIVEDIVKIYESYKLQVIDYDTCFSSIQRRLMEYKSGKN